MGMRLLTTLGLAAGGALVVGCGSKGNLKEQRTENAQRGLDIAKDKYEAVDGNRYPEDKDRALDSLKLAFLDARRAHCLNEFGDAPKPPRGQGANINCRKLGHSEETFQSWMAGDHYWGE